eukprot:scpid64301/ scgid11877/ Glycosyltransferase 1 domain-containing protein 1
MVDSVDTRSVLLLYATSDEHGGNSRVCSRISSLLNKNGIRSTYMHASAVLQAYTQAHCSYIPAEPSTPPSVPLGTVTHDLSLSCEYRPVSSMTCSSSSSTETSSAAPIEQDLDTLVRDAESPGKKCHTGSLPSPCPDSAVCLDMDLSSSSQRSYPVDTRGSSALPPQPGLDTADRGHLCSDGPQHRSPHPDCRCTSDCFESRALTWYCRSQHITHIIACHAYRCHAYVTGCPVPYSVMFGGTDINHDADDAERRGLMTPVIEQARHVVCFSRSMYDRAIELWPACSDKMIIQAQSVERSISRERYPSIARWLRSISPASSIPSNPVVFMLVAGIRPVKDPLYLVDAFHEWHCEDPSVFYVIIGSVLDEEYHKHLQHKLASVSGVFYHEQVEQPFLHHLMQLCCAVVNSSLSEGMCQAILEAIVHGAPVIARDIAGNRELISHRHTGLLYSTPEECIALARELKNNRDLHATIAGNAYQFIQRRHGVASEIETYRRIVSGPG